MEGGGGRIVLHRNQYMHWGNFHMFVSAVVIVITFCLLLIYWKLGKICENSQEFHNITFVDQNTLVLLKLYYSK